MNSSVEVIGLRKEATNWRITLSTRAMREGVRVMGEDMLLWRRNVGYEERGRKESGIGRAVLNNGEGKMFICTYLDHVSPRPRSSYIVQRSSFMRPLSSLL